MKAKILDVNSVGILTDEMIDDGDVFVSEKSCRPDCLFSYAPKKGYGLGLQCRLIKILPDCNGCPYFLANTRENRRRLRSGKELITTIRQERRRLNHD